MFDIGWTEFLVIGVVALVVIGPKELPRVLRTMGQGVRKLRHMAGEFQGQFNEALREAELSDLKDSVSGLRSDLSGLASNARESISKALPTNPLQDIETDLKAPTGSVEAGTGLPPAAVAEPTLPAPGDLEPHPFETVEDEVRNAAAGLEASAPAAASAPAPTPPATPSPSTPDAAAAPRPQTAAAPAEASKPAEAPKSAETTKSTDTTRSAEPTPAVTPAAKPKRARAAAVADTASADSQSAEASKPAPRRAARKPVAATEAAEPELFEAVASLDQGAPVESAAKPAAKRATKPRVKVKPASGNEGPAL